MLAGATGAMFALGLLACASATNLDVSYKSVTTTVEAGADGGDAGEAGEDGAPPDGGPSGTFAACPCDSTLGLACCVPKTGSPFCTASADDCVGAAGVFLECQRPTADSVCCWHAKVGGGGSVSTYAGECDGGTPSCVADFECPGSKCSTTVCDGITMGACGNTPPSCP